MATADSVVADPLEFTLQFGIGYLTVPFSSMLFGVAWLQAFLYFRSFRAVSDPKWLKLFVAFILVVDTIHQASIIHIYYHYLIIRHNDLDQVLGLSDVWSVPVCVFMMRTLRLVLKPYDEQTVSFLTAVIAFASDCFLTFRVRKLSGNWIVAGFCGLLTFAHFACALVFHVLEFQRLGSSLLELALYLRTLGIVVMSLTAAADTSIMAAMSFYLLRRRTGFRRTNTVVMLLLTLSIVTGALSSLLAIGNLISFFRPMCLIFWYGLSGKVYVNSLLTLLNVRSYIAGVWDEESTLAPLTSFRLTRLGSQASRISHRATVPPQIHVLMEQSVETDYPVNVVKTDQKGSPESTDSIAC